MFLALSRVGLAHFEAEHFGEVLIRNIYDFFGLLFELSGQNMKTLCPYSRIDFLSFTKLSNLILQSQFRINFSREFMS